MPASASHFFASMVEPTVAEFVANPLDIRRGRLTALVLHHMVDHFALDGYVGNDTRKRIDDVRTGLRTAWPDLPFIEDVADATKHARLDIRKSNPRYLSSSEQLSVTPGLFQAPFGEGVFSEAAIVFATLDNGSSKALLPAVCSVLAAWKTKL